MLFAVPRSQRVKPLILQSVISVLFIISFRTSHTSVNTNPETTQSDIVEGEVDNLVFMLRALEVDNL